MDDDWKVGTIVVLIIIIIFLIVVPLNHNENARQRRLEIKTLQALKGELKGISPDLFDKYFTACLSAKDEDAFKRALEALKKRSNFIGK